ncbi:hypothetical protein ACFX15_008560 [Malus domestica]
MAKPKLASNAHLEDQSARVQEEIGDNNGPKLQRTSLIHASPSPVFRKPIQHEQRSNASGPPMYQLATTWAKLHSPIQQHPIGESRWQALAAHFLHSLAYPCKGKILS